MKTKTTQLIEISLNDYNPDLVIFQRQGTNGLMVYSKKPINGYQKITLPNTTTNMDKDLSDYDKLEQIENNPEYTKIEEI